MVIVGRLQVSYDDFFVLNLSERKAIIEGYEINQKDNLYAVRRQTFTLLEPHLKKGHGLTETRMWPFDWEEQQEIEHATKEDFEIARKTIDIVKKLRHGRKSKNRGRNRGEDKRPRAETKAS